MSEALCSDCCLPQRGCICSLVPKIDSSSQFWLLTHDMEHDKPSNTGKLISLMWPETRIINWSRVSPDQELLALLEDQSEQVVLVFPEQYASEAQQQTQQQTMAQYSATEYQQTHFIILDATWQQARKIYRQSVYLQHLPLLSLSPESPSIYTLRRNRHSQHLCTAEVAALVLTEWNELDQALLLESLVQVYCDQYLWSRKGQRQVTESRALQFLQGYRKSEWSGICQNRSK